MCCVQVLLDLCYMWQMLCDSLTDDPSTASFARHRPDALAFNFVKRQLLILEFTRASDKRENWSETTDAQKRERYTPLCSWLKRNLPSQWTVDILTLSLGVRGSFNPLTWHSNLARLGIPETASRTLMQELTMTALTECDALFAARRVALTASSATPSHGGRTHAT